MLLDEMGPFPVVSQINARQLYVETVEVIT